MHTRSQRLMRQAWQDVREVLEKPEATTVYRHLAQELPALVRNSGLLSALAFHRAKSAGSDGRGQAHRLLLRHVTRLLGYDQEDRLLSSLTEMDAAQYLAVSARLLDSWVYHKRLAEAYIEGEEDRGG